MECLDQPCVRWQKTGGYKRNLIFHRNARRQNTFSWLRRIAGTFGDPRQISLARVWLNRIRNSLQFPPGSIKKKKPWDWIKSTTSWSHDTIYGWGMDRGQVPINFIKVLVTGKSQDQRDTCSCGLSGPSVGGLVWSKIHSFNVCVSDKCMSSHAVNVGQFAWTKRQGHFCLL